MIYSFEKLRIAEGSEGEWTISTQDSIRWIRLTDLTSEQLEQLKALHIPKEIRNKILHAVSHALDHVLLIKNAQSDLDLAIAETLQSQDMGTNKETKTGMVYALNGYQFYRDSFTGWAVRRDAENEEWMHLTDLPLVELHDLSNFNYPANMDGYLIESIKNAKTLIAGAIARRNDLNMRIVLALRNATQDAGSEKQTTDNQQENSVEQSAIYTIGSFSFAKNPNGEWVARGLNNRWIPLTQLPFFLLANVSRAGFPAHLPAELFKAMATARDTVFATENNPHDAGKQQKEPSKMSTITVYEFGSIHFTKDFIFGWVVRKGGERGVWVPLTELPPYAFGELLEINFPDYVDKSLIEAISAAKNKVIDAEKARSNLNERVREAIANATPAAKEQKDTSRLADRVVLMGEILDKMRPVPEGCAADLGDITITRLQKPLDQYCWQLRKRAVNSDIKCYNSIDALITSVLKRWW